MKVKTFDDLELEDYSVSKIEFENGHRVEVTPYGNNKMKTDSDNVDARYTIIAMKGSTPGALERSDTGVYWKVCNNCTKKQVTEIMKKVQNYPEFPIPTGEELDLLGSA